LSKYPAVAHAGYGFKMWVSYISW